MVMGKDGKPDIAAMEKAKQDRINSQVEATFGKPVRSTVMRAVEFGGGFLAPGIGGPKAGVRTIESAAAKVRSEMAHLHDAVAPAGTSGAIFEHEVPAPKSGTLEAVIRELQEAVSVEGLGPAAKKGAAIIASKVAERAHETMGWMHQSTTRMKDFAGGVWNHAESVARSDGFAGRAAQGVKETDPSLIATRKKYNWWASQIARQDRANGVKDGPKTLSEIFGSSKLERGMNPEQIMLNAQLAADTREMQVEILREFESAGLARKVPKGAEEKTEALSQRMFAELEGASTAKTGLFSETIRAPNGEKFWVHNHAKAVYDNAITKAGMWERQGIAGMGFRGLMQAKNQMVPIRLGFSLFHPLHVAHIDNSAYIATAWKEAAAKGFTPTAFMQAIGGTLKSLPLSYNFWANPKIGARYRAVFERKVPAEQLTKTDAEVLKYSLEGGFIPSMSARFRASTEGAFVNAVKQHSLTALWKWPGALMSQMQKPLFETWIPNLKHASYINEVRTLQRLKPELFAEENRIARQIQLRRIAKSVDNRYGEMSYDTLFWNPMLKDLTVLNTLSLGWQLGFLREYGGGAIDAGQFLAKGGGLAQIAEGKLDRPMFVGAYTTTALMYGGLLSWALSGKHPGGDLMDYLYPRTGETGPDGKPARVSTMFYTRELASIFDHMQKEGALKGMAHIAESKSSGLFGLMHDWATGLDNFNREFRDPNGTRMDQLQQTLAYTLKDLEPISVRTTQEKASSTKQTALNVLGFTPAPRYATESKTQSDIMQSYSKYVAPQQTSFDKAQYSADFKQLQQLYMREDPKADDLLDKMSDKYNLTPKEIKRLVKSLSSEETMEQRLFSKLPWKEQKRLLDGMSPEEREEYLQFANKTHVQRTYEAPDSGE
jgi:hypothetical protein